MRIVYHEGYGWLTLPDEVMKKLDITTPYEYDRTDPKLADIVETNMKVNINAFKNQTEFDNIWSWLNNIVRINEFNALRVVTLPNGTTDWLISDYDGSETVYCVIDGRLNIAWCDYNGVTHIEPCGHM